MNKITKSFWYRRLSLVFFTVLTIVAILTNHVSIFYLIYVFWWDELIKTAFDFARYVFKKNQLIDLRDFKTNLIERLIMLAIYLVFIIVCFGIIIEWKVEDLLFINVQVLVFQNIFFNLSLISFIGREAYVFANTPEIKIEARNIFSKGVITLHISILLGLLFWGIASNKIGNNYIPVQLTQYSRLASVLPFLIIKFIFDWLELSGKGDGLKEVK